MALVLLASTWGCGPRDSSSQVADPEKWIQVREWSAHAEGGMLSDVNVPSDRWQLLLENTGDDYVMVGVADASGKDVAIGTATEKEVDTIQVIGSRGVHKIAIAKMGQDGKYRVVLEVAPE